MKFSIAETTKAIIHDVFEIKESDLIKNITIISPDFSVNRSINRSLLMTGRPLLNVRIETFPQHVKRVTEQKLINTGVEDWNDHESRMALQKILEEIDFDYFRPAKEFPSYSFYLHRVISQLRICVPSSRLKDVLEGLGIKGKELYLIYAEYLKAKQQKADYADKLRRYQSVKEILIIFPGVMENLSLLEKEALKRNQDIQVHSYQAVKTRPELIIRNPLHQTAEIRDTIREILTLNTNLDRVAIIAPSDYLPAVFREARELDLPVYCPFGEELQHYHSELFKSTLDVIATDFDYQALKLFFQLQGKFAPIQALIDCGVAKGGSILAKVLEEKIKHEPKARYGKLKEALVLFEDLINLKITPHIMGQKIVDMIIPESHEKYIIRALITEIETIAPKTDYDRWQQLLEERLSRLKTASRDRNQAIYLTTDFLPGDFDYVFLLGLKEGNFPKRCKEDPILLDHERDTINSLAEATLQTAKDINLQQMESLNFSSACARKKWIGSFPAMDLISGDQEFSSFFLIDVIREMNEGVALDQQLYEDSLQKCRSDWIAKTPDMCLDYLDWSIHHLFSDPDVFINHILANNDGRLYFT